MRGDKEIPQVTLLRLRTRIDDRRLINAEECGSTISCFICPAPHHHHRLSECHALNTYLLRSHKRWCSTHNDNFLCMCCSMNTDNCRAFRIDLYWSTTERWLLLLP